MPGKKKEGADGVVVLAVIVVVIGVFNLITVSGLQGTIDSQAGKISKLHTLLSGAEDSLIGGNLDEMDVSNVNINDIQSTAQSIAALFPVDGIKTADDAIKVMIPSGTPWYGPELGVTFEDPVNSLAVLARMENQQLIKLNPEDLARYVSIVTKPVGISCEYCCGVDAIGVRPDGTSACGCQHNPALLTVTRWLVQNSDYSDPEIIREALKWKSLFFPKNMVENALKIAGGDTSVLTELPGMVGGC